MTLSRLTKLTIISTLNVQATVSTTYFAVHLMESGTTKPLHLVMTSLGSVLVPSLAALVNLPTFLLLQKLVWLLWKLNQGLTNWKLPNFCYIFLVIERQTLRLFAYLMTEYFSRNLETIESHMLKESKLQ